MAIDIPDFDVAVIGAGITGCLAARRLAELGSAVALLEAGQDPSHPQFLRGLSADRERQPVQSQADFYSEKTAPFLIDDIDYPYTTPKDAPFLWFRGRQLGGLLHLWDGCCPRFTHSEFSGEAEDIARWPISYEELEPYYASAEHMLEVTRVAPSPLERRVKQDILKQFPEAEVIARPIAKLKFQILRQKLAEYKNLNIITNAIVCKLVLDRGDRRIKNIRYINGLSGEIEQITARAVMLCASTLESTRMLLNSACAEFPEGLGNSSGVLGRFLMDHSCGMGLAGEIPPNPNPNTELSEGIYIYRDVQSKFPRMSRRYGLEAQFPSKFAPDRFWIYGFGEVAPNPGNRVVLDNTQHDRWGIPVLRIEIKYSREDVERINDAREFMESVVSRLTGVTSCRSDGLLPPGSSIHSVGTARMGDDANTSFLNKFNQSWSVPNLFVTDGSAFPSSAYQNPTLTMVALTLRACEVLVSQMRRRSPLEPLVQSRRR